MTISHATLVQISLPRRNKLNEFPERSKKEKAMKFHRFIFAERGGLATSLLIVASLNAVPLPRRRAPCKNLTSQGVDKSTLSIFRYYATQMNLRA